MWVLQLSLLAFVLTIINCFQWATGVLAMQTGRSFWRWYLIAQLLPAISLIMLLLLWEDKQQPANEKNLT